MNPLDDDSEWHGSDEDIFKMENALEEKLIEIIGQAHRDKIKHIYQFVYEYKDTSTRRRSVALTPSEVTRQLKSFNAIITTFKQKVAELPLEIQEQINYERLTQILWKVNNQVEAAVESRRESTREEKERVKLATEIGQWLKRDCNIKLSNYDPRDNSAKKKPEKSGVFARVLICIFEHYAEDSTYVRQYIKKALKKLGEKE